MERDLRLNAGQASRKPLIWQRSFAFTREEMRERGARALGCGNGVWGLNASIVLMPGIISY